MNELSSALLSLFSSLSNIEKLSLRISNEWKEILGSLSPFLKFDSVNDNIIIISVTDSIIFFELTMKEKELLQRFHEKIPESKSIEKIRFIRSRKKRS